MAKYSLQELLVQTGSHEPKACFLIDNTWKFSNILPLKNMPLVRASLFATGRWVEGKEGERGASSHK